VRSLQKKRERRRTIKKKKGERRGGHSDRPITKKKEKSLAMHTRVGRKGKGVGQTNKGGRVVLSFNLLREGKREVGGQ